MKAARYLDTIAASQLATLADGQEDSQEERRCPYSVMREAVEALGDVGIPVALGWSPAAAVMIAEACNWAAKTIDDVFYYIKSAAIEAAVDLGADGGWGEDDCFYLSTEETGVACFHDPYFQIGAGGRWPYRWSGIQRQHAAFLIATRPAVRRLYAEATKPGGAIYGASDSAVRRALHRLMG